MDSIHLAEFVAAELKNRTDLSALNTLDLCAGCGVIGIELSWYLPALRKIDFVEVQSIYAAYFERNVQLVNRKELALNWHLLNYDALLSNEWKNKYDLIISNPPYFYPQHGVMSPSQEKNRSRFFIDSSFENYIAAIVNSLAEGGEAYILLRSLEMHGEDVFSNLAACLADKTATVIGDIRGTNVVLIK